MLIVNDTHRLLAGQLPLGSSGRREPVEGAPAGDDPGRESLVSGGERVH